MASVTVGSWPPAGVAHRSGRRARAPGPALERPRLVHPRDAASAGAHLGQVDGRDPQHVAAPRQEAVADAHPSADLVFGRPQYLAALYDRRLRGRSSHVEADDVGSVDPRSQVIGPDDSGRRARFDAEYRPVDRHVHRRQPAVRLHDRQRYRQVARPKPLVQVVQILRDHRPDIGVDDRRARSLVLSHLRQDLAGQGEVQAGYSIRQHLRDPGLMVRVRVRVQQRDRHRPDPLLRQPVGDRLHVRHIERLQHLSLEAHTLAHLKAEPPLHQGRRFAIVEVVQARRPDAAELQDVPEPGGGDERRPLALPLEDRIRRDGEAVSDLGHVAGLYPQRPDALVEPCQDAAPVVVGGDQDPAGDLMS